MNIDDLLKSWDGFNPKTVQSVINAKTPMVSVVMLSYMRRYRLTEGLEYLPTFDTPLNMALRVQQGNENDTEVFELLEKFHDHNIMVTPTNIGTGVPRHERLHTALDKWDTPFIMFTDDDMRMPRYSIELLTSILIDNPEFGAVNMSTAPNAKVWRHLKSGALQPQYPKTVFDHEDVASIGSATLVVRREVFEDCDLDPEYIVGLCDIDFGLQMYEKGWKMGMLNIPNYQALNLKEDDAIESRAEYKKSRNNKEWVNASVKRFNNKWPEYI